MVEARLSKEQVPHTYRRVAPIYDLWAGLTETRARNRCLELAAIRDGEAVLEVAVGTGAAFEKILDANPAGRNEGIDLTEAMLARARDKATRSRASNWRLEVGDAYDLDFADNSFDLLINNYMFDLLPAKDFPTVLGEFKRVLRPEGRLVLVNMTEGEKWYNKIWTAIYMVSPGLVGGCRGVKLLPHLEAAGFRELSRSYVSQFTFPSEIVSAVAG